MRQLAIVATRPGHGDRGAGHAVKKANADALRHAAIFVRLASDFFSCDKRPIYLTE
jgi:hypothetical protein